MFDSINQIRLSEDNKKRFDTCIAIQINDFWKLKNKILEN